MKLILSGGGSGKKTEEIDKLFASLIDTSKELLYIPIAIDTFHHPYPECLKFIRSTFDTLGIRKYHMITEKDLSNISNLNINNFGGIYIGGGNTAYLLKMLKESPLWNFLKKAISLDIPIYGGSAGAIIFGKTILSSLPSDGNIVSLEDFSGMDSLKGIDIWCHYKGEDKEILEFIQTYNMQDTILLNESTGIYVENKERKIIGKIPAKRIKNNSQKGISINNIDINQSF